MELTDDVITLRAPRASDADASYAATIESLEELKVHMPWAHDGYERTETEAWITHCDEQWASGGDLQFFIFDRAGEFLGGCGLHGAQREIGYWVRSSAKGRGVATAAARLLARYCFEELGCEEVEIKVDPPNRASLRVAEKVGGVRVPGIERHVHDDGTVHELVVFTLKRAG